MIPYRIIKRRLPYPENHDWYAIHEVYYEDDGVTVKAITENAVAIEGETMQEIQEVWMMMTRACLRAPVLDYDELQAQFRKARKARRSGARRTPGRR